MATIEERAKENANKNGYTDKTWHASVGSYMLGATEQKQIDIEKAVKVYTNELRQIVDLLIHVHRLEYFLEKVGKDFGLSKPEEYISFEKCVKEFRKAMEDMHNIHITQEHLDEIFKRCKGVFPGNNLSYEDWCRCILAMEE